MSRGIEGRSEAEFLEEIREGRVLPVDNADNTLMSIYGNSKREARRKRRAAEREMNARGNSRGNLKLPLTTGEQFMIFGALFFIAVAAFS